MAFIFAALIFLAALVIAYLRIWADMMRPAPTGRSGALRAIIVGAVLAVAVAATHWLPHIGW